ncbi:MAG: hypothetical protein J7M38_15860 [Armatimonadetes bacterium]|nr:hypothetical protein [Armatimonadota bacterium]
MVTAMLALLAMAALVVDVGRLTIAAQRAQDIADSAALAGANRLPNQDQARATALRTIIANNDTSSWLQVGCSSEDIVFYGPGDVVPDYGELGMWSYAMKVTVRVPVEYTFARALGIGGAVATRSCTVMRAPSRGVPICTMWIAHNTPLQYGMQQQMLMADSPHCADIPGSFGFLQSPDGCTAAWDDLLRGYPLTDEDIETAFVKIGDSVWAKTGVDVGLFVKALEKNGDDTARLERAATGKWADDTFDNYHKDNPRIMLVPLVTYVGGTGSGAEFRIERFGAFWLEEVNGGQKTILGRFIEYDLPGSDVNNSSQFDDRVFATTMLR